MGHTTNHRSLISSVPSGVKKGGESGGAHIDAFGVTN